MFDLNLFTSADRILKGQNLQRYLVSAITAVVVFNVAGSNAAGQRPDNLEAKTITLGIVSKTNQREVEEHFRDFAHYVARKLFPLSDTEGKVVVPPTISDLVKGLEQKQVDFYMDSPYPTYVVNVAQGAGKLLLRRWQRDKPEYQSLIFTKSNSGINRLQDLRGRIIVFEDPDSTSGHFLPKFYLLRNGFKLAEKSGSKAQVSPGEIGYVFAYSQENLVNWVLTKQVAAGAFSDDDYARLEGQQKSDVAILAETERLPRHLVSVRSDLSPVLADRLKQVLLSMPEDDEGRRILQKTGETTKFDDLPGGEEGMRRRLLETFYSVGNK
jgi:phosphate/phosphite/phosphonate ABC transporter binding protein